MLSILLSGAVYTAITLAIRLYILLVKAVLKDVYTAPESRSSIECSIFNLQYLYQEQYILLLWAVFKSVYTALKAILHAGYTVPEKAVMNAVYTAYESSIERSCYCSI
jgi:hypothetical protein